RIAECALYRVRKKEIEESGGIRREAGGRVLFHLAQYLVLDVRRELRERRAFRVLCIRIDRGETGLVGFARGRQRPAKRTVDVTRGARFRRAWSIGVGRNQPRDYRFENIRLRCGQSLQRLPDRRRRTSGLCRKCRGGCSESCYLRGQARHPDPL